MNLLVVADTFSAATKEHIARLVYGGGVFDRPATIRMRSFHELPVCAIDFPPGRANRHAKKPVRRGMSWRQRIFP